MLNSSDTSMICGPCPALTVASRATVPLAVIRVFSSTTDDFHLPQPRSSFVLSLQFLFYVCHFKALSESVKIKTKKCYCYL